MTVLVPGDIKETEEVIDAALEYNGPVYIRNSAIDVENVYHQDNHFIIGKATQLREGQDITIITTGTLMNEGAKAVDILKDNHGINTRLLQMASIKPLDNDAVRKAADETGKIITLEEHNIIGGLGSAVAEVISEYSTARLKRLGIKDHFCDIVGDPHYLLQRESLSIDKVITSVKDFLNN